MVYLRDVLTGARITGKDARTADIDELARGREIRESSRVNVAQVLGYFLEQLGYILEQVLKYDKTSQD